MTPCAQTRGCARIHGMERSFDVAGPRHPEKHYMPPVLDRMLMR